MPAGLSTATARLRKKLLAGIGLIARGVRQDRVMDVDHRGALDMLHRRDLVHPGR